MTAAARAPQSLMAFDFGLRRTGVATGQRLLGLARPLTTVTAEGDARFERIAALVREWQPYALVVGVARSTSATARSKSGPVAWCVMWTPPPPR